jgi:hypothetical protein
MIKQTIGALLLVGVLAAGCGSAEEARKEERTTEAEDVRISECTNDAVGMLARLEITNNSSKRSTYTATVAFESPDQTQQFDTALVFVDAVEPGQSTTAEAHSLIQAPGEYICRVTTMDRTEDVG